MLHLPVGCRWQPGEDVPQVGEGVDAAATAVFDDGVEDGAAFSGSGVAHEEPVFLADFTNSGMRTSSMTGRCSGSRIGPLRSSSTTATSFRFASCLRRCSQPAKVV